MASSGTWDFSLSNAEIVQSAYALIGVRRTSLIAEHMVDARIQLNLMLSSWANLQPNLWEVDLVTESLVQGTATYAVDAKTVMILDAYIRTGSGASLNDRLIFPVSRSEYASYPNKETQAFPSVYWFNRLIDPTITLWQVPDASSTYTLRYYRVTQVQDANLPGGETPDIPYRWLDAMVSGLAARLAKLYAPSMEDKRQADADKAWNIAATQDTENVGMTIAPQLGGYYR